MKTPGSQVDSPVAAGKWRGGEREMRYLHIDTWQRWSVFLQFFSPGTNMWTRAAAGKFESKETKLKSMWYYWKTQRTEATIYVETGDFCRDPVGILKKGKNRILYFRSGRSSLSPSTKSKNWTIKGKSQSRDCWYQFSKKQLLYINKSWCRIGLRSIKNLYSRKKISKERKTISNKRHSNSCLSRVCPQWVL